MTSSVLRLDVDDETFLVTNTIDRCPRVMMLRELAMNAVEAARRAEPGNRRVELLAVHAAGGRKLAIRNTGPGLSREELYRICDLGASFGKLKALDGNFGIGGKVATLGSNPLGVRYRSCKAGRVHQVLLGRRGGRYGRVWLRQDGPDQPIAEGGPLAEILDVTDRAVSEGHGLEEDWTEVVLYGHSAEQDTVADPHGGEPAMPADWIPRLLTRRFYRLDPDIEVMIGPGLHPYGEGPYRFHPLADREAEIFAEHDLRHIPGTDVRLRFLHALPGQRPADQEAAIGAAGLVHKGEFYDFASGPSWIYDAPKFGLALMARDMTVVVELPDEYEAVPDTYRQFLRYKQGTQTHVALKHFAPAVLAQRPDWVRGAQARRLGERSGADRMRQMLRRLMDELGFPAPGQDAADGSIADPPTIYVLRTQQDLADMLIADRAGRYVAQTNELFVNAAYAGARRLATLLSTEAAGGMAGLIGEDAVSRMAEQALVRHLAGTVVRALAMGRDPGWNAGNLERALSPESLTIAADDLYESLPGLRATLRAMAQAAEVARPMGVE